MQENLNVKDLNKYLFQQMERLNSMNVKDENLNIEIERAKAIALTASQIISNVNTQLRVEYAKSQLSLPQGE